MVTKLLPSCNGVQLQILRTKRSISEMGSERW